MVIPTRRRGGRMPLKPPPFHTSKSIVYVDCSISTRETCSSRLCFLIQAVWFEANTQNMTTANNINFPIFFLFWWIHWSIFKSFQFFIVRCCYGLKWWWSIQSLTHLPSKYWFQIYGGRIHKNFEWREKKKKVALCHCWWWNSTL